MNFPWTTWCYFNPKVKRVSVCFLHQQNPHSLITDTFSFTPPVHHSPNSFQLLWDSWVLYTHISSVKKEKKKLLEAETEYVTMSNEYLKL